MYRCTPFKGMALPCTRQRKTPAVFLTPKRKFFILTRLIQFARDRWRSAALVCNVDSSTSHTLNASTLYSMCVCVRGWVWCCSPPTTTSKQTFGKHKRETVNFPALPQHKRSKWWSRKSQAPSSTPPRLTWIALTHT